MLRNWNTLHLMALLASSLLTSSCRLRTSPADSQSDGAQGTDCEALRRAIESNPEAEGGSLQQRYEAECQHHGKPATFQADIDSRRVDFGQAPNIGSLKLLVSIDLPALPLVQTASETQVETVINDVDVASDDEYQCTTRANFTCVKMQLSLADENAKDIWHGVKCIEISVSQSSAPTRTPPQKCANQFVPGQLIHAQFPAHGSSYNVEVGGGQLVLRPFDNGLWLEGEVSANSDGEAQLTKLMVPTQPRKLHWGFHQSGSQSGTFFGGGFVTMKNE